MTTVAKRAFVCGFCSQSGYHDRCPGVVGGLDCTCTHPHSPAGDVIGSSPAAAVLSPETGSDGQDGHPPLYGTPLPPLVPGSEAWLKTMSASKVAAVLGLSPYDSRFSLWHRMANLLPPEPEAAHLARGHYLEPGILAWFKDQHPDWTVTTTGSWAHPQHPLWTAAPDGEAYTPDGDTYGVEVKTAANALEWGQPGTDQIPAGYRAQVVWQMHVRGTRRTYIAVLSAYLEMCEYVIDYDPAEAAYIETECQAFLDTLPGGPLEKRPNIDDHGATYDAIRQFHPLIEQVDVELDPETARQYCHARHALKAAEAAETYARSLIADELGNAKRARFGGQTIAQRQAKGEGTPYLVAGKNLPTFTDNINPQEAAAS
jgi:putative phage-type endonuclease